VTAMDVRVKALLPVWCKGTLRWNGVLRRDVNRHGTRLMSVVTIWSIPDYGHSLMGITPHSPDVCTDAATHIFKKVMPWKCAKRKFASTTAGYMRADPMIRAFVIGVTQLIMLGNLPDHSVSPKSRPRDTNQREWIYRVLPKHIVNGNGDSRGIVYTRSYIIILCIREYVIAMARSSPAIMYHMKSLGFDWAAFVSHNRIQTHILRGWLFDVPGGHCSSVDRLNLLIGKPCCTTCRVELTGIIYFFERVFRKYGRPPLPITHTLCGAGIATCAYAPMIRRIAYAVPPRVSVGAFAQWVAERVYPTDSVHERKQLAATLCGTVKADGRIAVYKLPTHHGTHQLVAHSRRLSTVRTDTSTRVCIRCVSMHTLAHVVSPGNGVVYITNAMASQFASSVTGKYTRRVIHTKLSRLERKRRRKHMSDGYGYAKNTAFDMRTRDVVCIRGRHALQKIPPCGTLVVVDDKQYTACVGCGRLMLYDDTTCHITPKGMVCDTCECDMRLRVFRVWWWIDLDTRIQCAICGRTIQQMYRARILMNILVVCESHMSTQIRSFISKRKPQTAAACMCIIRTYRRRVAAARVAYMRARSSSTIHRIRLAQLNKKR